MPHKAAPETVCRCIIVEIPVPSSHSKLLIIQQTVSQVQPSEVFIPNLFPRKVTNNTADTLSQVQPYGVSAPSSHSKLSITLSGSRVRIPHKAAPETVCFIHCIMPLHVAFICHASLPTISNDKMQPIGLTSQPRIFKWFKLTTAAIFMSQLSLWDICTAIPFFYSGAFKTSI